MDNGPGHATNPKVAPGAMDVERLRRAGFSDAEVSDYVRTQDQTLTAAGFTPSERAEHWGNYSVSPDNGLTAQVKSNLKVNGWNPGTAKNPLEAFAAGWNMSVTGLALAGKKPDMTIADHASFMERMAYSGGQLIGDLPVAVTGFAWGAAAGAAAGGGSGAAAAAPSGEAAAPATVPIGVAVGGVVGAGFGSAALPEGVRQGMLTYYGTKDGTLRSWADIMNASLHGIAETGKQGVIGAVAGKLGGMVGGKVLSAGASPAVALGADATTQALAGTAVGGALNGHVPDKEDFATAAALALTFHAGATATKVFRPASASRVQKNLEEVYRETGIPPWQAADQSSRTPRSWIASITAEGTYGFLKKRAPSTRRGFSAEKPVA